MTEVFKTLLDQPPGPTTEEYQKGLQSMAAEWLKQTSPRGKGVRYTWANGLNDAASNILGAMMLKRARDQELAALAKTNLPVPSPTAAPTPLGPPGAGGPVSSLPLPPGVPGRGPVPYAGTDPGDPATFGYPTFT
jgi:hypothetical protein